MTGPPVGPTETSDQPHILVGVTGGIAAYKACEVVRRLREAGFRVTVAPTASALRFVGEPTWAALSGEPVLASMWQDAHDVRHVRIAGDLALAVVVPATAHTIARMAWGLADDGLTGTLLAATCPVLIAPAMHTQMWEHPATQHNVAQLMRRGVAFIGPVTGRLTGADSGVGRLAEPDDVVAAVLAAVRPRDLTGRRVLVTAGGTREPIDDVRFIGNHSSGRQGAACAAVARRRGAEVVLIAANLADPPPSGVSVVEVHTAAELARAVADNAIGCDAIVMAAAVADFRPRTVASGKLSKAAGAPPVELVPTEDVLATLGRNARNVYLVGFAAESEPEPAALIARARAKLVSKGADLIVANDISGGAVFGSASSRVWLVDVTAAEEVTLRSKTLVAEAIWDRVAQVLNGGSPQPTESTEPSAATLGRRSESATWVDAPTSS